MNYQKLICWGDSQTFGARTYGCYPLYLVEYLDKRSKYRWSVVNLSTNGHTARDLWFRVNKEILNITDIHSACILIGTNDVGNKTPVKLFGEYYRQIISSLRVFGFKVVHCGEIPPIWPDSLPYFDNNTGDLRKKYNKLISEIVEDSPIARMVKFPKLKQKHFVDPVHLNEGGNKELAKSFLKSILNEQ